jgi:hypothetical protein
VLITPLRVAEYRDPVAVPVIDPNGKTIVAFCTAKANAVEKAGVAVSVNMVCPVDIDPEVPAYADGNP